MYEVIAIIAVFFSGIILTAAIFVAIARAENAKRRKPQRTTNKQKDRQDDNQENKQDDKRKFEYSKLILALVLFTYFVGVGLGSHVILELLSGYPEWTIQALIALFGFIGTPTITAIGFYAWKARAENAIKIKKENPKETDGIPVDLNNFNV